jgi:hypothetical protein
VSHVKYELVFISKKKAFFSIFEIIRRSRVKQRKCNSADSAHSDTNVTPSSFLTPAFSHRRERSFVEKHCLNSERLKKGESVRFEVFTAVTMKNGAFWGVTLFLS